jgi:uncharacterized protein YkwD
MRCLSRFVVLATFLALIVTSSAQAQLDPVASWLERVTDARLDAGLSPLSLSPKLAAAAQRHADDLAANAIESPTGSDASSPQQRIADAGYVAWTLAEGEPVVGEIYQVEAESFEQAFGALIQDAVKRGVLLSPLYREIGIGVAQDSAGRYTYVVSLGARPNVLPIFINDGAPSATDPLVAVRLTNETVRPEGQGAAAIGRAIEFRIGDQPNWEELPWQPWEELIPWMVPVSAGQHTIYVQYRDAAGRVAASAATIFMSEGEPATPTPFLLQSDQVAPAQTPAGPTEGSQATLPADVSGTPALSPSVGPAYPPVGVTPFPTWTPLPTTAPPPAPEQPDFPIGLVAALEGLAVIMGIYLVLHRRGGPAHSDQADRLDG